MKWANENNPRTYIGDGVYAEFDGSAVIIRTDRDERDHGQHWIALGWRELDALMRFWHKCHEPGPEATKTK